MDTADSSPLLHHCLCFRTVAWDDHVVIPFLGNKGEALDVRSMILGVHSARTASRRNTPMKGENTTIQHVPSEHA